MSFVVTGANAGAAETCVPVSCTTDANGEVRVTYTGAVAGTGTINAAITVDGARQTATAEKKWEATTPGHEPPPPGHEPPPSGHEPPPSPHGAVTCSGPHGTLAEGAAVWRSGFITCTLSGGSATWSASGFSLGGPNGGSTMTFDALEILGPAGITATPASGPALTQTFVIV